MFSLCKAYVLRGQEKEKKTGREGTKLIKDLGNFKISVIVVEHLSGKNVELEKAFREILEKASNEVYGTFGN